MPSDSVIENDSPLGADHPTTRHSARLVPRANIVSAPRTPRRSRVRFATAQNCPQLRGISVPQPSPKRLGERPGSAGSNSSFVSATSHLACATPTPSLHPSPPKIGRLPERPLVMQLRTRPPRFRAPTRPSVCHVAYKSI